MPVEKILKFVKPNVFGNLERGIGIKLCESINLIFSNSILINFKPFKTIFGILSVDIVFSEHDHIYFFFGIN
jgi:hypothetical protein